MMIGGAIAVGVVVIWKSYIFPTKKDAEEDTAPVKAVPFDMDKD